VITRRTALGAGLAVVTMAYGSGSRAFANTARRSFGAHTSDILLLDSSIEPPEPLANFIKGRHSNATVFPLHLDAASHSGLMRVLKDNDRIIGVSSGATLFCLERLAWDHGYRMTGRTQACASALGGKSCQQDIAAFIGGAHSPSAAMSPFVQSYRPSRADGVLHAWSMQKSVSARMRQARWEGWQ
jgi:hypothetical protein